MKVLLAEKLLVEIMKWTLDEVSIERPLLQAMANLKYDEYQQFSPGIRFIESLAQWLEQFETKEERKAAYEFIKKHLIFISSSQIAHLVNLSFSMYIKPILIEKTGTSLNVNKHLVKKITDSEEYKNACRKSLFIGLSDGSRIDQLRRFAHLDNEQILTSYYIDEEKISDIKGELQNSCTSDKFTSIFLIDDFTASGTSYARVEGEEFKGKILKLFNKIYNSPKKDKAHFSDLVEKNELSIHIIFYVATEDAISNIKKVIEDYKNKYIKESELKYDIHAVQIIKNQTPIAAKAESNFISIIKQNRYFDESIIDKHYKKGKCDEPYFGFNECALPLILNHNTPNNSFPILWFSDDDKVKGLFPRVKRHKE